MFESAGAESAGDGAGEKTALVLAVFVGFWEQSEFPTAWVGKAGFCGHFVWMQHEAANYHTTVCSVCAGHILLAQDRRVSHFVSREAVQAIIDERPEIEQRLRDYMRRYNVQER